MIRFTIALAAFLFLQSAHKPAHAPKASSNLFTCDPTKMSICFSYVSNTTSNLLATDWSAVIDTNGKLTISDPDKRLQCTAGNLINATGKIVGFSYVCIEQKNQKD